MAYDADRIMRAVNRGVKAAAATTPIRPSRARNQTLPTLPSQIAPAITPWKACGVALHLVPAGSFPF